MSNQKKITKVRRLIQEKFGYTEDLPGNHELHDDVTERNLQNKKDAPQNHPMEAWRKVVKALLGATTTEEDGIIEHAIDYTALRRLASKHGFSHLMDNHLNSLEEEFKKPKKERDIDKIKFALKELKDKIPFWFLGLLPTKNKEEMPEEDKKSLTNLLEIMDEFNKRSEDMGKKGAKDTEHASRKTAAKKNLDAARKDAKMDKEAGSEKKMKDTIEELPTEHKAGKSLEVAKKDIAEPAEENKLNHDQLEADKLKPKGEVKKN